MDQGKRVSEVGVWEEDIWSWRLRWRRTRFQWKVEQENELLTTVDRVSLSREAKDTLSWCGDSSSMFSVKSAYECVNQRSGCRPCRVFTQLWQTKAFPNVLVTAWRVLLDRLPTRACLVRRGVTVPSLLCVMCGSEIESTQRLFVICKVAQRVWDRCLRWVGILYVQHYDLQCHFEQFCLLQINHKQNCVWKGVWAAVVRCLWEQRNIIVFKQGVVYEEEIFHLAQIKAWLWMKYRMHSFNYTLAEWHLNPIQCLVS